MVFFLVFSSGCTGLAFSSGNPVPNAAICCKQKFLTFYIYIYILDIGFSIFTLNNSLAIKINKFDEKYGAKLNLDSLIFAPNNSLNTKI